MTDKTTVRIVVVSLALVVVGGLAACALLAAVHTEPPSIIPDAIKIGLGALGTLLATTRTQPDPTVQQVADEAHGRGAADMLTVLADATPNGGDQPEGAQATPARPVRAPKRAP